MVCSQAWTKIRTPVNAGANLTGANLRGVYHHGIGNKPFTKVNEMSDGV